MLQQTLTSRHTASSTHDAPGILRKGDSELPPANSGATYDGKPGAGITIADIRRQAASLGQAGKAFDALFTHEPLVSGDKTAPGADRNGHPQAPELPMSHAVLCIILTMKAGSNKAIHITAFLTEKKSKKKTVTLSATWPRARPWENNIIFCDDDDHPCAGISSAEWGASNCAVMAHLIQKGVYHGIEWNTTSSYEWDAILDFDYIYQLRPASLMVSIGAKYPPTWSSLLLVALAVKAGRLKTGSMARATQDPGLCRAGKLAHHPDPRNAGSSRQKAYVPSVPIAALSTPTPQPQETTRPWTFIHPNPTASARGCPRNTPRVTLRCMVLKRNSI